MGADTRDTAEQSSSVQFSSAQWNNRDNSEEVASE